MSKPLFLKIFFAFAGSICVLIIRAQQADSTRRQRHDHYVSFGALTGGSVLLAGGNKGNLSISFPYTVSTLSGARSDSVFKSKAIQPFAQLKAFALPIFLEVGNEKQFLYFRFLSIAAIGDYAGCNFSLGYGRSIWVHTRHGHAANITDRQFVIKPSVNIELTPYRGFDNGSPFYLGTIDNRNKYIKVLGYTAGPTFTVHGKYNSVYNANTLDAVYAQTELAVVPKISISNNPFKHLFHWQINMGYNIDLFNRGGIILRQNFYESIKKPSIINFDDRGIVAKYNGHTITSVPYNLSGFYLGVELGLNIRS
ncbi:MAG TPA: hypothetical protein VKR53_04555 [Puia sp.]|nr:hypothetical protein [Puia sp.]